MKVRVKRTRTQPTNDKSSVAEVQERRRDMFDASEWCDNTVGGGSGPFVIDCADCPVGLGIEEQVGWARGTSHPMMDFPKVQADVHWWSANDFGTHSTLAEIDEWRQVVLEK